MELYKDRKKDLDMVFIDLEKLYDIISGDVLQECLEKKEVSKMYISTIKDIYEGVKTSIRILEGDIEDFPIDIGLYQGKC